MSEDFKMPILVHFKALANLQMNVEERSDVSTITSRSVDLQGDIIEPDGLKWDTFTQQGSPVHYAHNALRVGQALWVKSRGDSIVAKTQYSKSPSGWNSEKPWIGDVVWLAVQKGILPGKSITVLPEKYRKPTSEEADRGAKRVITAGTVMEFSVCKAPVNSDAVVEEIHKALDDLVNFKEAELDNPDCQLEMAREIERVFNVLSG